MQFDPNQFLDVEMSAPLERRPPLPPGDYTAVIGEVKAANWSKGDKSGTRLIVPLAIEIPPAVADSLRLNSSSLTLTDSIMLDTTEQGTIDMAPGRNSRLRLYREALDMNKPGDTFSPRRMQGRPVKVKLSHEMWQDQIQERVDGVARP